MAVRALLVKILGDDRDLQRAFASSSRGANQFGTSVERSGAKADKALRNVRGLALGTGAAFGGGLIASEVLSQANAAIQVASNLNEQISRTNVVFGSSAAAIQAWAETTAQSIGVAEDEALSAAGTFGAMFAQAGRSEADAARLSQRVVTLASDLASFSNVPIDDALTALRSGLSGEIEPLRRFQVFLTEAAVSQRALTDTGKTSVEQLTQGEKIMARYALILEQTTKQQGDFARTSDGLANSQRILSANTRDLQGDIGSALLPAMEGLTGVLVDATELALGLTDALGTIGSVEIPTIVIPFTAVEVGGGGLGETVAKGLGIAALGAISPATLLAVAIKQIVDKIRGESAGGVDTSALAAAFDEQWNIFTNAVVGARDAAAARAAPKVAAAFGDPGFKPDEVNEFGQAQQAAFERTLDALDLQFDRATFAGNTQAALAALDEIVAAINERIAVEGRTTELLRLLFQVEQERANILEQGKQERQQAAAQAAADALTRLGLGVSRAELTPSLQDDLDALNTLKEGIEAQIAAGKNVLANQERLVSVEGQIAGKQEQIDQNRRDAVQARQFRAIGLSAEGDKPTPTVANLRKQIAQLSERLVDEGKMTPKIRAQFKAITDMFTREGKNVTDETLETVRDMVGGIRSGLGQELNKDLVPDIRAVSLSDEILNALGFGKDADVTGRLGIDTRAIGRIGRTSVAAPPPQVFTGPITVVADNPDAFLREMQKKANRTTATSRGRFPGKSMGLG